MRYVNVFAVSAAACLLFALQARQLLVAGRDRGLRRRMGRRHAGPTQAARLGPRPAQREPVQHVTERVHRWLDEVVPDRQQRLILRGPHQRAGDLVRWVAL